VVKLDREEYLAYSRRSAREVARHGGKVIALGQFSEAIVGEIEPATTSGTSSTGSRTCGRC
jgi:uncharacterized protein (DUF1330 family)